MLKALVLIFVVLASSVSGGIPDARKYDWGKLEVPEDYNYSGGQKLQIYWERLKSTTTAPQAIVLINGGPGMSHDSYHNMGADGKYQRDYFEALRTDFDVYYFDQRGTGNSSPLSFNNMFSRNIRLYDTLNICRDIEELRKNVIKQKKIAVLGESYGGLVALLYAITYPESVSKVVIHDSTPHNKYYSNMHLNFSQMLGVLDQKLPGVLRNMTDAVAMFDANEVTIPYGIRLSGHDFLTITLNFTYSVQGQNIIALMVRQIVNDGESSILNAILGLRRRSQLRSYKALPPTLLLVQTLEMQDEGAFVSSADSSPWTKAWMSDRVLASRRQFKSDFMLKTFNSLNLTSRLGRIKAPTLVLVGDTDFVCPPWYAEEISGGIADSRLVVVKNAAHGGFIEQPSFTIGRIRDFLLGTRTKTEYEIRPMSDFAADSLDAHEIRRIWLEGASRLGLVGFPPARE